ncbi:MAG: glycosyl hydrolase [Candidatus Poribacteria bacterium]|nr:glycosyl hydrolase [Candidatus Poribacteria bacterium]
MDNLQPDPSLLQGLRWRCIGPPRGGRVVAVAGHPTEPAVFYFGACAGGVWKTDDGGTYWENISDGFFNSAAVGAIAVAESDPNVIYAGTGETTIRLDVSYGDGVYKSTDSGKTWTHIGLADTRHIGKIRIHPENPDLVYVAALGHAFGPNAERGVFRSKDGGGSWEKVLFRSEKAGAVDLAMDPSNPRVLYAPIWEAYRNFWELSSGGPDSSFYKSTDGGDTWTDITNNPGLPEGIKGKIGIVVSPAKPNRVWAIIEAEKGGLYRSDDGGETWELLTPNRDLWHRPWYYCHIYAHPQDPETVYILNLKMWKSSDGGRTFTEVTTPHGDNHDLWIDPQNPQRMIEGNDGGACVSFNGGESWSTIYNQLTSQFYRIDTDNRFPYRVYATQQDNSSISVPSANEYGGIPWTECYPVGTGESGDIVVHPNNPDIAYIGAVGSSPGGGGALQRYDHRTRQIRLVNVWPEETWGWGAKDLKYRFAWTFPIAFSPHDPNVLYTAGNLVFRSTDEGSSWEAISPDLTRNDVTKLGPSGGPITKDTSGAEQYATVYAFAESPHEAGVLWAGSDDGLIHISRDGGANWNKITPPDLPEWSLISNIETSPHHPSTAYVAVTRYKLDDYQPYLYKTDDYGQTWRRISSSFPDGEITRVIREDPVRRGLLYVGTETGVYVSVDDGERWQRLQNNLPVVPVYDLKIKEGDLVAGTHGRSFWILDDLTPLRQLTTEVSQAPAHLVGPRPTDRRCMQWGVGMFRSETGKNYMMALGAAATYYMEKSPDGERQRRYLDAGENPPQGVIIYYLLKNAPTEPVTLTFLDATGAEIKTFTSKTEDSDSEDKADRYIPAASGLNRFVWDMRYPDAQEVSVDPITEKPVAAPPASTEKPKNGPIASPGTYQVRLTVGDQTYNQSFELRKEPRVTASQADLDAQFELWLKIRDKLSETNEAINRLRRIQRQVGEWTQRITEMEGRENEAISQAAAALGEKLKAIETELIQTEADTIGDRLRLPTRLNVKLAGLISVVSCADAAPPQQAYDVFEHLSSEIDTQLAQLQSVIDEDVAALNNLIREADVPAIVTQT